MISIAMTTFNGEKYLKEQIDSILNQTYQDFEIVICDDCSTDNTIQILKEYEACDNRIKLFLNEKNLGFLHNFEKAISYCTGEYIAFSDQDDIWETFKLERSLNTIGQNDVYCSSALLVTSDNIAMKNGTKKRKLSKDKKTITKYLLDSNFCQGSTMLAKSDFIKKHIPIPEAFIFHDYYFAFEASLNNGIVYDSISTIRYRQHGNNVTQNKPTSFIIDLLNTQYSELERKYKEKNTRFNYIINLPEKYPEWLIEYAKLLDIYNQKMYFNKDFWSLKFFIKNYNCLVLDPNIFHKSLMIFKRFLGVIKFQILHRKEKN